MNGKQVAEIRQGLDSILDEVDRLVISFKFQEAEEKMVQADELFEKIQLLVDPTNQIHRNIVWNRRTKMEALYQKIQEGLQRREAGKREDGNIAFKCNWNDAGYKGICSQEAYLHNIRQGRPWCLVSRCRNFTNVYPVPDDICYEARALLDCTFAAGWDHDYQGKLLKPRKITSARQGKLAILTTEPPNTKDRIIVAVFPIERLFEDPGKETWIYGDKSRCLDDMLEYGIEFWRYHKNPGNPNSTAWATGLFRYISDVSVLGILEEYVAKKSNTGGDTATAEELLKMTLQS